MRKRPSSSHLRLGIFRSLILAMVLVPTAHAGLERSATVTGIVKSFDQKQILLELADRSVAKFERRAVPGYIDLRIGTEVIVPAVEIREPASMHGKSDTASNHKK